jgi:hypothetical protein
VIDLGNTELDIAILDGLDRVLATAKTPGWTVRDTQCALDTALWSRLTDLTVGDPDAAPEDSPTLVTMALVAEKLGESLIGLPLIDHLLALRVLQAVGGEAAVRLRDSAASRDGVIALALPADQARSAQPALVPSGAIADWVLSLTPDGTIGLIQLDPDARPAYVPNLADLPVARIEGRAAADTLASDRADLAAHAALERKTLYAAALAGMCRKAITLGAEYAATRELFGAPIGAFQALAHSLSTAKLHADGAELLAREAAWTLDGKPDEFERRARMAYAFASAAGDIATRAAVHVFGGYGVTRDYPAQNYFRNARALSLIAGDRRLDLRVLGRDLVANGPFIPAMTAAQAKGR